MKKWKIIDLVRSFCIVVVMGVHFYSAVPFAHPWAAWLWGRFCFNGIYGVFLFFVISGFLITNIISKAPGGIFKPTLLKFYARRIGRIWPLFFLYVGLELIFFEVAPRTTRLFSECFPSV